MKNRRTDTITYMDVLNVIKDIGTEASSAQIKDRLADKIGPLTKMQKYRRIPNCIALLQRKGLITMCKQQSIRPHQGGVRRAWIQYVRLI